MIDNRLLEFSKKKNVNNQKRNTKKFTEDKNNIEKL